MIYLLTGGSKSGKSRLAEEMALSFSSNSSVLYIATMKAKHPEDRQIVARHQKRREGLPFIVMEKERDLDQLSLPPSSAILIEDIPNLLANAMFDGGDPTKILSSLQQISAHAQHLLLITNEVGADGQNYEQETMAYVANLGKLNFQLGLFADTVMEVVCGIPIILKGSLP